MSDDCVIFYILGWHLDSTYGSSSAVVIDPKKKITIVWITNLNIKWTDEAILKLMEFLILAVQNQ